MNDILLGIEKLKLNSFKEIKNKRVALICNQASVVFDKKQKRLLNTYEIFLQSQQKYNFKLEAIWGPQHGFFAETQDNMIEWSNYQFQTEDSRTPIFSLYGKHREPTSEMLQNIDTVVFDLQDIGTRYYTYIWTMLNSMKAISGKEIKFIVLDRPNPLGGNIIEGPIIDKEYYSFVGMAQIPIRHSLTTGELVLLLKEEYKLDLELEVIKMENWNRDMLFHNLKGHHKWVFPSPNMPSFETALVYPGGCLFEATNISEGRGTTKPFLLFGAPFFDNHLISKELRTRFGDVADFIPMNFIPTFHKYKDQLVKGVYIYVTDIVKFRAVRVYIYLLHLLLNLYPTEFMWKNPPYEYEMNKMPIDILFGSSLFRESVKENPQKIINKMNIDEKKFDEKRKEFLLY